MDAEAAPPVPAFLAGGGEMGALMRAQDWAATPLGPPAAWPQSLRTTIRLMLTTHHPMFVFWGEALTCLYNDAYSALIGPDRHPTALGRPGREVWAEIWDVIGPDTQRVMAGQGATWHERQLISITRGNRREDVWWTYGYSPIDEDAAPTGVGGVLVICRDVTAEVQAERAHAEEAERLRQLFEQAPGFMALLRGPDHVYALTNAAYQRLIGRDVLGKPVRAAVPEVEGQGFFELLDQVYATGEAFTARSAPITLASGPDGTLGRRFVDFLYQPIRDAAGVVTGIFVEGSDVTEAKLADDALRANDARQVLLLALSQGQRETADPEAMMRAASEALARHLGASRAGFYDMLDDATSAFAAGWSDGSLPVPHEVFPVALLGPAYVAEVRAGRAVGIDDLAHDPRTADGLLAGLGVGAGIGAPILRDGGWRAGMYVHQATVRRWTAAEVALVRDVAEQTWNAVGRARAVAALRASEALWRGLFERLHEGLVLGEVVRDAAGRVVDWRYLDVNPAWEALIGLPRGRAIGRTIREAFPGIEDAWIDRFARVVETGEAVQFADNASNLGRWYEVNAFRIAPGRFAAVFRDVTDRRRAEAALQELNETLERRVEERTRERDRAWKNSQDLQAVLDKDGAFRAVNEAWTGILGWQPGEIVGRRFLDLVHPEDHPAGQAALDTASRQELPTHENRYRHRDGTWRWISWLAAPDDGLVYASGRHVTAEKQAAADLAAAQEQLRQAQKMEAVGQLTGGIAHDFNNLLTGIIGALAFMQRRVAEGRTADLARYAGIATASAQRAAALTQRLLAFARRQPLDPRPVEANRLVASMEELLRRTLGPGIALELALADGLWTALCDPNQLENAILNLAINARDAMPGGGRLTIGTANAELGEAETRAEGHEARPGRYVAIVVTDTGTGMAPEVAARVFEPFFTTKPIGQGTGLGLSMLYGFVRQSGGHVQVGSVPGRGTTMRLYLPRHCGAAAEDAAAMPAEAAAVAAGGTVLLVEDEAPIRLLVTETLAEIGCRVLQAEDGPAGLRVLQSNARVDLLLTDVGLPGGLNGRQLADAARERRPGLPVLFMTGYVHNAAFGNGTALEPGMEMLTKPFTPDGLAARVRDMIGPRE